MRFRTIALHKYYFDVGFGVLSYLKYGLVASGLVIKDVNTILWMILIYGIVSYMLGWWVCNSGFKDAENDVNNQFNPFTRKATKKLKL